MVNSTKGSEEVKTYKEFIAYLMSQFKYTYRGARKIAAGMRDGVPFQGDTVGIWYYRSDRKYEAL